MSEPLLSRWAMFRPFVESIYRMFGHGPEPSQYVTMTDERRYWIERTYPG